MQLVAWDQMAGSILFACVKEKKLGDDFAIPLDIYPNVRRDFGYHVRNLTGKRKSHLSLDDMVFHEKHSCIRADVILVFKGLSVILPNQIESTITAYFHTVF